MAEAQLGLQSQRDETLNVVSVGVSGVMGNFMWAMNAKILTYCYINLLWHR